MSKSENLREIPLSYFDHGIGLDKELMMIGELVQCVSSQDQISCSSIQEIGYAIESYLNRKWAAECYYLKRKQLRQARDDLFAGEMNRLKAISRN